MRTKGEKNNWSIGAPAQGYTQMLTAKKRMLDALDAAREDGRSDKVPVVHGFVAEAQFRKWLKGFLPLRYGVTSGYIVSQGTPETQKLPHFDVIIYDRLNAPVLWVKESPDSSEAGMARGISVEHVRAVLEVKTTLNRRTAKDALDHLNELDRFLSPRDSPDERYPRYLPAEFFRAAVFFEVRETDKHDHLALQEFLRILEHKHYFDSLVLRSEALDFEETGRIEVLRNNSPGKPWGASGDLVSGHATSEEMSTGDGVYSVWLRFSALEFATFAFDLVALLNGKYERGRVSSFHGGVAH